MQFFVKKEKKFWACLKCFHPGTHATNNDVKLFKKTTNLSFRSYHHLTKHKNPTSFSNELFLWWRKVLVFFFVQICSTDYTFFQSKIFCRLIYLYLYIKKNFNGQKCLWYVPHQTILD